MNALTRIPSDFVIPEKLADAPFLFDYSLLGVMAAIAIWGLLHAALAVSWLSAGQV